MKAGPDKRVACTVGKSRRKPGPVALIIAPRSNLRAPPRTATNKPGAAQSAVALFAYRRLDAFSALKPLPSPDDVGLIVQTSLLIKAQMLCSPLALQPIL